MKRLLPLIAVFFLAAQANAAGASGKDSSSAYVNLPEKNAVRLRDARVARLSKKLGAATGYKAGLTNPDIQKKFGIDHPLLGVLLEGMLLPDGTKVPHDFGARPMAEGDLLLRVGDECINSASSRSAALKCLDAVIPFIELPDAGPASGAPADASFMLSTNVGAALGVMGVPIDITQDGGWEERLASMEVRISDGEGNLLAAGRGNATLGNPLNSALWIRDELLREGKRLKKGDLLSVGSFTMMLPVRAGLKLRAEYSGLLQGDEKASVSVEFK